MSHVETSYYRIQAEKRQREYLNRISENTQRFINQYQEVVHELIEEELDRFMPAEFSSIRKDINHLSSLVNSDPQSARDFSKALGDRLYNLRRTARKARNQIQRDDNQRFRQTMEEERQRQQQLLQKEKEQLQNAAREEAQKIQQQIELRQNQQHAWREAISELSDPIIRDFATEELIQIQQQIEILQPNDIRQKISQAINKASVQANDWKKQQNQENTAAVQSEVLENHIGELKKSLTENPEKLQKILLDMENTRNMLDKGKTMSKEEFSDFVDSQTDQADDAVTDERCRKKIVQGIVQGLRQAGFTLKGNPQRIMGEKDEVVVQAQRPSGSYSKFSVGLDGSFAYKFDNYEGMACKKDIDKILPKLQDVYGLELSDRRVIWQNPDRINSSARPLDNNQQEKNND